jgi:hypothetical protein
MTLPAPWAAWIAVAAVTAAGCAPPFGYRPAVHDGRGAAVVHAGVRVSAAAGAWRGAPLAGRLWPVRITIDNESERPLRVGYRDFTLITEDGHRLPALPAFDLAGKDARIPKRYAYPWSGFHLAPHLFTFYRGFWTGAWPFAHDERAYESRYRTLRAEMAPSVEMQRHALPEGVLEPGGYITGTLYFSLPAPATTLTATLVDAASQESFGTVEVPVVLAN